MKTNKNYWLADAVSVVKKLKDAGSTLVVRSSKNKEAFDRLLEASKKATGFEEDPAYDNNVLALELFNDDIAFLVEGWKSDYDGYLDVSLKDFPELRPFLNFLLRKDPIALS